MNIEAYNAESLRKLVRTLENENRLLKEKLDREHPLQATGALRGALRFHLLSHRRSLSCWLF